ncbi:MAG: FHA domain-containing protein [Planctomycetota bacterium]
MQFWSDEDGVRRSYPLREGSLIIGRQPSCDIVVPGRNVSKRHAECFVERGVVTIRDLGSANGTFVNGSPVTTCILKDGDKLLLGGYQLVLDAELPLLETMAGPQAARAAAPPTQPPPDAQQEAPSFAEEPAADDTPVDGTFMPQAYDPQSLQPQVVARDGHMYLRDPRTSREVEIVPRGATPATDLSGYYAGQEAAERKRNMYLIAGAIAVGLLMIIALAWTSGSSDNGDQPRRPAFPREKYNEITEKSIDQMSAGNFKEAAQQLTIAHEGRPTYGVAAILRDIAREWEKSGKNIDEFNWLSVESSLRELMKNRWSTAKVRNFASGRIDWTYDVQHHQDIVEQAIKLLNADDPEKALAEFQKLPKHSIIYRKHESQIAETVTAACMKRLRLAKDALDRGNWQAVIQECTAANKYASDVHKAAIARAVRIAKKRMLEEQRLTEANARFREDEVPSLLAALKLLDEIEDGGPLGQRKAAMRMRIEARLVTLRREEMARVANAHYEAGRGGEAIKIITVNQLSELYPLRTRIERMTRLLKEAQAACDAKDYDLAKSKWNDAALEESSPRNAYRKAALDKLKELADRRKEIALEYRAMGDLALRKEDNPAKARNLYLTAMRWDPLATTGKSRLADMRHLAEVFYHQARDLRYQGKKKEAIELFEKVRQYVEEGSKFHEMATRQLGELRAELPEKQE